MTLGKLLPCWLSSGSVVTWEGQEEGGSSRTGQGEGGEGQTCGQEGGVRIRQLGQILTTIPGLGGPKLAARICASYCASYLAQAYSGVKKKLSPYWAELQRPSSLNWIRMLPQGVRIGMLDCEPFWDRGLYFNSFCYITALLIIFVEKQNVNIYNKWLILWQKDALETCEFFTSNSEKNDLQFSIIITSHEACASWPTTSDELSQDPYIVFFHQKFNVVVQPTAHIFNILASSFTWVADVFPGKGRIHLHVYILPCPRLGAFYKP